MVEIGPENYKRVIKNANKVEKFNIKRLKPGESISGLNYFRDKIKAFLDRNGEKPINKIWYHGKQYDFPEVEDSKGEDMEPTPDFKNLENDPKARGADGYMDDNIQGIIDEEKAKEEENK